MSMRSITTWTFEKNEPLRLTRRFADWEGTALFYSGGRSDAAVNTFLCLAPEEKKIGALDASSWEDLKLPLGSPFSIPSWVGYLGYEMGCLADPDKTIPHFIPITPPYLFYRPSVVIHFNHQTQLATLYSKEKQFSLNRIPPPLPRGEIHLSGATDSLESYQKKIAQIKEWILGGELYQLNLSQEFHFKIEGEADPFGYFEKVTLLNPAPFSVFLNCGEFSIVSSSPERLLCKRGERLESRPIKGTIPRGLTPPEDLLNQQKLKNSEKERAELLMITDLMRSDLGKIAQPASVHTREIFRCEAYENVFHLLSIIEAKAKPECNPFTLIRSIFPGGSVTGCPKLRAMEAITQLEQRPRGVYTGSIGYLAANGDFDFNIAIRTLIVHRDKIQLQLGGGIVLDSDPLQEYEETLHKGRSLFSVLNDEASICM